MVSLTQPKWAVGRWLRENISAFLTPRYLKRLRDFGLVKWRPTGIVRSGKRKNQVSMYEYLLANITIALDENTVEKIAHRRGGNEMSNGWSERNQVGRCCLNLVRGAQIRERPVNGGFSYDLIHREEVRGKNGKIKRVRVARVLEAKYRPDAETEAARMLATLRDQPDDETVTSRAGIYNIREMAVKFLKDKQRENIATFSDVQQAINNRIVPFFGNLRLNEVTLRHLKNYRDKRRGAGIADITVGKDLQPLSALYNFAKDEELYNGATPVNIRKLKLRIEERERLMSREEQKAIWSLLPEVHPMDDLADFAYGTCMRPKNILNHVTWDRIHFDAPEPYIFIAKSEHKNRTKDGKYFLTAKLQKMLRRRQAENVLNFPLVFWRLEAGKPVKITEGWVQRRWNEVLEKAGIREKEEAEGMENLRFYDLKHSRLSRVGAQGVSVFTLKRISNHKSTASLEKYVKGEALNGAALKALEMDDTENGEEGV